MTSPRPALVMPAWPTLTLRAGEWPKRSTPRAVRGARATSAQATSRRSGRAIGGSFTSADHDQRLDALLFAKRADDAARFYSLTSIPRRAAFAARIAMQRNSVDAESLYQAAMAQVTADRRVDDGSRALLARQRL